MILANIKTQMQDGKGNIIHPETDSSNVTHKEGNIETAINSLEKREETFVQAVNPKKKGFWVNTKASLSGAEGTGIVDRLKKYMDSKIGILSELLTTKKSNLVEAINENTTDITKLKTDVDNNSSQLQKNTKHLTQLSNPSLLINGNFRNPINQRQKTTYNTMGYSIDRWCLSNGGIELKVNNGFITLTTLNEVSGCECEQFIEFPSELSGKSVTISFKYKTTSKYFKLFIHSFEKGNIGNIENDKLIKDGNWHEVSVTINVPILTTDNKFKIGFQFLGCPKGETVDIEYIKLELGLVATPFVPRPYGEELDLCQRYYFRNRWLSTRISGMGSNIITTVSFYYPTTMRIAPTVRPLVEQPVDSIRTMDYSVNIINPSVEQIKPRQSGIINEEMIDFQFDSNLEVKDYSLEIKDYAYEFDSEIY